MNLSFIKSLRSKKESQQQQSVIDSAQRILDREKDKEQMRDFVKSLGQITGPEIIDEECRAILDSALMAIHTIRMGIKEGVENI